MTDIGANPGPQYDALTNGADILFFGGAKGGSKTVELLLDGGRFLQSPEHKGYVGVIFRRQSNDLTKGGGIWDRAHQIFGGIPDLKFNENSKQIRSRSTGNVLQFAHLSKESDAKTWDGQGVAFFGFDEGRHFTEKQWIYIVFSCLRSTCGVKAYARLATNPDPGWCRQWAAPWVAKEWPHERPEAGEIMHILVREPDEDVPAEVEENVLHRGYAPDGTRDRLVWLTKPTFVHDSTLNRPRKVSTTFSFIPSTVYDNPFLASDDDYMARMFSLSKTDRAAFLYGSWDFDVRAGDYFDASWWRWLSAPPECVKAVRCWDLAATEVQKSGGKAPDWTVGALVGQAMIDGSLDWVVLDVVRFRGAPGLSDTDKGSRARASKVEAGILACHNDDPRNVVYYVEEERGASGKYATAWVARVCTGRRVVGVPARGDKADRAAPISTLVENGRVHVVKRPWSTGFVGECHGFTGDSDGVDDQVDAFVYAMHQLPSRARGRGQGTVVASPRSYDLDRW